MAVVMLFVKVSGLYVWLGVLALSIIALGLVVWYYRRWMFAEPRQGGEVWTLDGLRALRDSGQISPEEYEKMRMALIGSMPGRSKAGAVSQGPGSPDASGFEVQNRPPDGR